VRFQVDVLAGRENLDSEAGLLRATRAVFETIDRVRSRIMTDKLLQELATAFPALNIRSLFDEYRHRRQRSDAYRSRIPADTESDAEPAPAPPPAEERELCAHLAHTLDEPEIADTLRAFMPLHLLRHASCRELLRLLLEAGARGEPPQALLDAETHPPDFMQFAAAVLMAPAKAGTREYSHMDAVRSLVLRIWQRELRRRRDALPEDQRERRVQLTYDLKALRDWETGCAVIEMELDAD
jgi:hypothetical protein